MSAAEPAAAGPVDAAPTSAQMLGQYRRELRAEGIPAEVADQLVLDFGQHLTDRGIVIGAI